MVYPIYAVHDALVGFGAISIHNNDSVAMRVFADVFSDVKQKSDYSLYRLGTFDTDSGVIVSEPISLVCRATDFVNMKVEEKSDE